MEIYFRHFRKQLLRYKLVETQPIYHVFNGQNFGSQLLHLPQFFAMFKPRYMMMTEKIIEILKENPNYMATLNDIRCHFDEPLRHYFKRLLKHAFFQKFITLSHVCDATMVSSQSNFFNFPFVFAFQKVPYRIVFPNAPEHEWRLKNKEERTVVALQLTNPDMEMSEILPGNDTDALEEYKGECRHMLRIRELQFISFRFPLGYLCESHEVFEVPLLVQVYDYIRSSKESGVSEPDIGRHFGMSRLVRRSVVKEMKRCAKLDRFLTNEGRQKTGK